MASDYNDLSSIAYINDYDLKVMYSRKKQPQNPIIIEGLNPSDTKEINLKRFAIIKEFDTDVDASSLANQEALGEWDSFVDKSNSILASYTNK
jgi:hypothetical protein